jgi:hypothetical protein
MRKRAVLSLAVAAIVVISATAVFSHPGWRGGRLQAWDKDKLATLEGKVTDAERPVVKMEADGKQYILHLGPIWYWQEKGYTLEKDQLAEVTGTIEEIDGVLHVYPQTIKANEKSIELADENGFPVWAGRKGGRGTRFGRGYKQCEYGPGYGRHGRAAQGWRRYGHGYARGRGWHGRRG